MKKILIVIYFLIAGNKTMAQQNYDVGLIPKDILAGANAVIRNEETSIEVKDLDNVVYHVKKSITIVNRNGDNMAPIVLEHDKLKNIKLIKGSIYNAAGIQTGKFGEKDFEDVTPYDGFSLFVDNKIKHFTPAAGGYPYTIVYEMEFQFKQSLYFYDWEPAQIGLAVENATYTFICKPEFNIRYKEIHLSTKVQTSTNHAGMKVYLWQVNNVKASRAEPFGFSQLAKVKIASEEFNYGGMPGAFNSWETLGKWEYDHLLYNRDGLPLETITQLKNIVAGINDPKLKAKKLYEYMQQRTHYVSVQVGIGGFQPFLASDVDKLNYGDCKALVNYTYSLLKAVGIESWYCVVTAGRNQKVGMIKDFPSMNQGNHVILCLPFKNDTTWLECTSQQLPFGFLGSFTDDRTVLACTPEGGKLLNTPEYTMDDNLEDRRASLAIDESGKLTGEMLTTFKGAEYDARQWAIEDSQADREKGIKRIYQINNLEIQKLEFKQDKSLKPITTETVKFSAIDYASVNDGKLYFTLNSLNRVNEPLRQIRNRLTEININRGITKADEIIYTLPKGYRLEKQPLNINIVKPFGNYSATMVFSEGHLIYKRKFQLKGGKYNKDTYQDLVDFYQDVVDADNYTVTLVKGF
ncbi:MAG TPA: DUF3857 domain-containing protein [Mucilaginibacter sp.]|jgi:hypothetical protein